MSTVIQASTEIDLEDTAVARKKPDNSTDRELVARLVDQARAEGVELVGENGLLGRLTKLVLESALEGEITDHLGHDKYERSGNQTGNTRNGGRSKTVLTDVGPVEITVPRDRDGSFEPKIVANLPSAATLISRRSPRMTFGTSRTSPPLASTRYSLVSPLSPERNRSSFPLGVNATR